MIIYRKVIGLRTFFNRDGFYRNTLLQIESNSLERTKKRPLSSSPKRHNKRFRFQLLSLVLGSRVPGRCVGVHIHGYQGLKPSDPKSNNFLLYNMEG